MNALEIKKNYSLPETFNKEINVLFTFRDLIITYSIFFMSLIYIGFEMNFSNIYFFVLILIALHLFFFQISQLKINSKKNCLKVFKSNNLLGFLVFINLLIGKVII